jgi:hypothetical protein
MVRQKLRIQETRKNGQLLEKANVLATLPVRCCGVLPWRGHFSIGARGQGDYYSKMCVALPDITAPNAT